ncbi:MAG: [Fe-Fe] hydrogenase large subunit C-terminal domain-containing protein [Victivallaceae bacterium]|nr:[Fe-Fe] hydrogenase large subunit C-terminal domain-containing protein [Victivallaceae bacterium]
MDNHFPVYTTPNECQDCYKCVRHCDCKAIQIVNARAAVIPELCVSCGECVRVCPAHAKKIRSDLSRVKFLLASGEKIYVSLAPSFVGFFRNVSCRQLAAALMKLGFAGVGETAVGAQLVSAKCAEFLAEAPAGIYVSSACPATVDFITKYHSEWVPSIVPVRSPVIAHARFLKHEIPNADKVVFIGPCAAKKNEADRSASDLALALTFPVIADWFEAENIDPASCGEADLVPCAAEEGRSYSLEGGMNDTIRRPGDNVRYIAVSGLADLRRVLEKFDRTAVSASGQKLFIEALACPGGCVNGPAMPAGSAGAETAWETFRISSDRSSAGRPVPVNISGSYFASPPATKEPSEKEIRSALASVGKFGRADELNCGGCGYNTCREFARAMLSGKAESAMCLSYLRKISQKTSTALIRYIPAGVVIADEKLQVIECNRHFAELCGGETLEAFNTTGSLTGGFLETMIDFTDLFEEVLAKGGELERFNQVHGKNIYNISVFGITPGRTAGAVIQDVTRSEVRREQIAEKAREVIRENVLTVQKIARDLGEHMAKTEILLDEVAGSYSGSDENAR